jgi:hypothetical protein
MDRHFLPGLRDRLIQVFLSLLANSENGVM